MMMTMTMRRSYLFVSALLEAGPGSPTTNLCQQTIITIKSVIRPTIFVIIIFMSVIRLTIFVIITIKSAIRHAIFIIVTFMSVITPTIFIIVTMNIVCIVGQVRVCSCMLCRWTFLMKGKTLPSPLLKFCSTFKVGRIFLLCHLGAHHCKQAAPQMCNTTIYTGLNIFDILTKKVGTQITLSQRLLTGV